MGRAITDIKQQDRRPQRVSIYLDGKYAFSLARDQLVQLGLKIGQNLTDSDVARLKDNSAYGKLRDLTYKWLSIRPRSAHEIDEYLNRKTADENLKNKVRQELGQYNYINDEEFAKKWITGRTAIKPMSRLRLKQELIQKRVPKDIIDEALNQADIDDLAAVKQVIAARSHRYPDRQKLLAYLSRQGFSYGDIKRALEDAD